MPALIEYIKVGICAGYGDGDFSVSMSVQNLSRKQWEEVQLATLTALAVAREHWLAAQGQEAAQLPKDANVCGGISTVTGAEL